ncbi:hypothetical protein [Micromonospora sp. SH-82]|uniref:hypothetical protein n=1 Tax=Micromonospora sp. SH-82 TaxID=3132938 RepID=UPI003EBE980A
MTVTRTPEQHLGRLNRFLDRDTMAGLQRRLSEPEQLEIANQPGILQLVEEAALTTAAYQQQRAIEIRAQGTRQIAGGNATYLEVDSPEASRHGGIYRNPDHVVILVKGHDVVGSYLENGARPATAGESHLVDLAAARGVSTSQAEIQATRERLTASTTALKEAVTRHVASLLGAKAAALRPDGRSMAPATAAAMHLGPGSAGPLARPPKRSATDVPATTQPTQAKRQRTL